MEVLSLFDGISCGKVALDNLGIKHTYYSSEIDKHAIKISENNYKDIIRLGDVKNINFSNINANLLIGGSPCTSFSIANTNRDGFNSENGKLFYYFVDALKVIKPKYFLYENVASMKMDDINFISNQLNIAPYKIDSAFFSAQSRKRLYWTNIKVDTNISNNDLIIEDIKDQTFQEDVTYKYTDNIFWSNKSFTNQNKPIRIGYINNTNRGNRIYSSNGKSIALTASSGGIGRNTGLYKVDGKVRRLSLLECERLQNLPDNYTKVDNVSDCQRYASIGRGWTVKVIEHILKNIIN